MRGVFITGTGTEVGKTVVAAAIARTAAASGEAVSVFKPALSGLNDPGEPDHELLRRASGSEQTDDEIAPYRYAPPLSPHLAAELAGETIDPQRLRDGAQAAGEGADLLVVEGVGGFMVPLAPGFDASDLAREMGFPVVLVVGLRLGCLNHALLTARAIAAEGLPLAGWIANTIDPAMAALDENIATLSERLGAPLLGILPHQASPDAERLSRHLDVGPLLP